MTRSLKCVGALTLAFTVQAATLGEVEQKAATDRLSTYPMTTVEVATGLMAETSGVRLAGLALTLPTISAEALQSLAGVQEDLLKSLEKVELPVTAAVGAGVAISGRELPWPTIVAFAAGGILLVVLCVFAGALIKLSMEDARKNRRLRRRYAP